MRRSLRTRLRKWLAGIGVAYALLMTFGGCADRLILIPTRDRIPAEGAREHLIPLGDGTTLDVWRARSPGAQAREPRAFLLEFCGNATRAEQIATYIADRWGEHPVEAWAVNYPGYGGSTGAAKLALI